MDKTIKLRKCPFCGSEAHLYKINAFFSSAYQAICSSCEASTPAESTGLFLSGHFVNDNEAIQKAIDKWNNPRSLHKDCV